MDTHGSGLLLQMTETEEVVIFSESDIELDNTQCKVLQERQHPVYSATGFTGNDE